MTKHPLIIKLGVGALFCLTAFVIYANSLQAPFQFDSTARISNNPSIRIDSLSWESLSDAAFGKKSAKDRPIGNITFALNYYFHGENPFGYHVVNVIIHVFAGFFLFLFLFKTIRLAKVGENEFNALLISCSSALLWIAHPVNTQSVTYLVQRLNSLAAMFFLLAFWLYAEGRTRSRKWPWFAGAALSWILALGSKQNTAVLPFLIFLYEWYFFQNLDRRWLKKNIKYVLIPIGLFAVAALVYLGGDPLGKLSSFRDFSEGKFTFAQRLLTQSRVIIYYLSLFFFPHPSRLNIDYDFPLSNSLVDPITTLLSMAGIIVLVGISIVLARRKPLISFCILWFFGTLAVESTVVPLAVIFEHRTYLPFTMLSFALVLLMFEWVRPNWLPICAVAVITLVFGFWTHQRNIVWQDPVSLWRDSVEKAPKNPRAHNNLGSELFKENRLEEAESHYRLSLEYDPDYAEALYNYGKLYEKRGRLMKEIEFYRRSIASNPKFVPAYLGLGGALKRAGAPESALAHFQKALQLDPKRATAHNDLCQLLTEMGKPSEAITYCQQALDLKPDFNNANLNLGVAYMASGNTETAIDLFSRLIEAADPSMDTGDLADLHVNLASALIQQGRLEESVAHLEKAIDLNPENARAHNNYASLMAHEGKIGQTLLHLLKALTIDSGLTDAQDNLQYFLQQPEYINTAAADLRRELEQSPHDPDLLFAAGFIEEVRGDLDSAEIRYQQALEKDPEHAGALMAVARIQAAKGNLDQSISLLKKVIEQQPGRADIDYNIACMYSLLGQKEPAVFWLQSAVEKGYLNWDRIAADPDLENIRGTEAYQRLMEHRPDELRP